MNKVPLIIMAYCIVILLGCEDKAATKKIWYQNGVEEATRDIAKNKIYIYGYGKRDHRNNIDPNSGLIFKIVGGCLIDDEIDGRTSGYNDTISEWLRNGGKSENTYADHKPFVCDDESVIMKTWESSPYVEIAGEYTDFASGLGIGVRKRKLENNKNEDVNADVIAVRYGDRSQDENPFGVTGIKNFKMKRNDKVPFLLYIEAEYLFDKQYHGIMIYDFREMMILRFFAKEFP